MPPSPLPLRAVAAVFLRRQHLDRPRALPLTAARLRRFVEDVGGLQIDSINVVERAHLLTLWSRFGAYDRTALDRLVYDRRLLFEYWAHAACLVSASTLPWWRRAMLDYRVRHTGWAKYLRANKAIIERVRSTVAANGPMANGDFERRNASGGKSGWWSWQPAQHALHYLWMTGALTIHSRHNFQKRYDLFERAMPGVLDVAAVPSAEFARWHVVRSLHAMGAATETDLSRYLTFPRFAPGVRRKALRELLQAGEVVEVRVEGSPARWLALAGDVPILARASRGAPPRGTTLLSPFDSLLWYRERAARLFGFDYRIEVYTPKADRVHGYYSLPLLHDGELIGRVDAKVHRADRRLEVRHTHFEPWFAAGEPSPASEMRLDQEAAIAGLGDALRSLATFVGADAVEVRRVTPARLRSTLKRRVAQTPSSSTSNSKVAFGGTAPGAPRSP